MTEGCRKSSTGLDIVLVGLPQRSLLLAVDVRSPSQEQIKCSRSLKFPVALFQHLLGQNAKPLSVRRLTVLRAWLNQRTRMRLIQPRRSPENGQDSGGVIDLVDLPWLS